MICPICKTKADESQDYCLKCAWEFEYYFDELSKNSKTIYDNRFEIWSGIYNELSNFRKALESGTLVPNKARLKPSFPFEPEMVLIKGGSFMMGSNVYDDEKPIHKVTIDYDFEVGKYPITVAEFRIFVDDTAYVTKAEKGNGSWVYITEWEEKKDANWENPYFDQSDNQPVVCVSWNDAKEYAKWLTQKSGKDYRLLTEAEWEYVTRAGTTTRWSFGDNKRKLRDYAWYSDNSRDKTHQVGTKKSNSWGVYDMYGNVLEWCEDWYLGGYKNTPIDGSQNRFITQNQHKILRGGSWYYIADYTHSAYRGRGLLSNCASNVGFRLQRTLP